MQQNRKKQTTAADSLFGMALSQAFMGFAFGADVSNVWEAGELASAVREDRTKTKTRANDGNGFKLGVKQGLTDVFAGLHQTAKQTIAEIEHNTFTPSFAFAAPRMAA